MRLLKTERSVVRVLMAWAWSRRGSAVLGGGGGGVFAVGGAVDDGYHVSSSALRDESILPSCTLVSLLPRCGRCSVYFILPPSVPIYLSFLLFVTFYKIIYTFQFVMIFICNMNLV